MTVVDPSGTAAEPGRRARTLAGWRVGVLASPAAPVYGALIGIFVIAWIVVTIHGGTFLTVPNVVNMLQRSVALGIMAAGQTIVIMLGSLDLSVAQVISLASLLGATTMDGQDANVLPAIMLVLGAGVVIGLANGLIITKLRVNAFIATLGTSLIIKGLIDNRWDGPAGSVPKSFEDLGYTRFGVLPLSIFLFAAVVLVIWFILRYTRFGYRIYAVGGSEDVSKLSGLRTHRTIIAAHVICSLAAVITGLFLASRLGAGTPTVGPDGGYDLESIAAVVLGGTALMGGRGGVIGTVGGVFILAVLDNTFNQLELNAFLKDVVRGLIIIAAVAVYARRKLGEKD
ncbi:ABC transporter permease [Candidatus Solirubrobacter pratensis]|uniref:ABC transporter permease n=1 Tax=Candidatus Solirubrobacter pratensis TaxID=1298857 RepID=UPI00041C520E|nr:ABC transporter permease [Candidatus Solirubrobacter pratensis]